jgi:hypothetical protein
VGVDKCIIIYPKIQVNQYTKSVSRVSVAFLKATGKINHDSRYNSNDIPKKKGQWYPHSSCYKLGRASFILFMVPTLAHGKPSSIFTENPIRDET